MQIIYQRISHSPTGSNECKTAADDYAGGGVEGRQLHRQQTVAKRAGTAALDAWHVRVTFQISILYFYDNSLLSLCFGDTK